MGSRGHSSKKTAALNVGVDSSRQKIFASAERSFAERRIQWCVRAGHRERSRGELGAGWPPFWRQTGPPVRGVHASLHPAESGTHALLKEFSRPKSGPTLEQVLEVFIRPSLEVTVDRHGRSNFTRLRAILSGQNSALLEKLIADNFDQSSRTFVEALQRCLPHLKIEDILWRFHFLLGAIYYTGAAGRTASANCLTDDVTRLILSLVQRS
jgi:Tetracyclin repressor-like, C-terminal domain